MFQPVRVGSFVARKDSGSSGTTAKSSKSTTSAQTARKRHLVAHPSGGHPTRFWAGFTRPLHQILGRRQSCFMRSLISGLETRSESSERLACTETPPRRLSKTQDLANVDCCEPSHRTSPPPPTPQFGSRHAGDSAGTAPRRPGNGRLDGGRPSGDEV